MHMKAQQCFASLFSHSGCADAAGACSSALAHLSSCTPQLPWLPALADVGCQAVTGCCAMQVLLMPLFLAITSPKNMILVAFAASFIKLVGLAIAQTKFQALLSLTLGCLSVMSYPAISSIKANAVPMHEQGAVQGGLGGATALASGLAPLALMEVYKLATAPVFMPRVCSCYSISNFC